MSLLTCSAGVIPSWTPKKGEEPTGAQSASLFMALYIIALGTGGIKPNGEWRALRASMPLFFSRVKSHPPPLPSLFVWRGPV